MALLFGYQVLAFVLGVCGVVLIVCSVFLHWMQHFRCTVCEVCAKRTSQANVPWSKRRSHNSQESQSDPSVSKSSTRDRKKVRYRQKKWWENVVTTRDDDVSIAFYPLGFLVYNAMLLALFAASLSTATQSTHSRHSYCSLRLGKEEPMSKAGKRSYTLLLTLLLCIFEWESFLNYYRWFSAFLCTNFVENYPFWKICVRFMPYGLVFASAFYLLIWVSQWLWPLVVLLHVACNYYCVRVLTDMLLAQYGIVEDSCGAAQFEEMVTPVFDMRTVSFLALAFSALALACFGLCYDARFLIVLPLLLSMSSFCTAMNFVNSRQAVVFFFKVRLKHFWSQCQLRGTRLPGFSQCAKTCRCCLVAPLLCCALRLWELFCCRCCDDEDDEYNELVQNLTALERDVRDVSVDRQRRREREREREREKDREREQPTVSRTVTHTSPLTPEPDCVYPSSPGRRLGAVSQNAGTNGIPIFVAHERKTPDEHISHSSQVSDSDKHKVRQIGGIALGHSDSEGSRDGSGGHRISVTEESDVPDSRISHRRPHLTRLGVASTSVSTDRAPPRPLREPFRRKHKRQNAIEDLTRVVKTHRRPHSEHKADDGYHIEAPRNVRSGGVSRRGERQRSSVSRIWSRVFSTTTNHRRMSSRRFAYNSRRVSISQLVLSKVEPSAKATRLMLARLRNEGMASQLALTTYRWVEKEHKKQSSGGLSNVVRHLRARHDSNQTEELQATRKGKEKEKEKLKHKPHRSLGDERTEHDESVSAIATFRSKQEIAPLGKERNGLRTTRPHDYKPRKVMDPKAAKVLGYGG